MIRGTATVSCRVVLGSQRNRQSGELAARSLLAGNDILFRKTCQKLIQKFRQIDVHGLCSPPVSVTAGQRT